MSGEHGDGLARSYLNEELFGSPLYEAFREVKRAFDPDNLMNPGKIVDGPSPIENLRLGANYKTLPLATTFDFSREGSFAKAAELCNGAGVCRKLQSGTMCPSFMVTRDEEHSTRGRANAPAAGVVGRFAGGGIDRPSLVRHLRSVPGLQGLQGRMSVERRRGQAEDGIPVALLRQARHAALRAADGRRRTAEPLGLGPGAGVELAGGLARGRLAGRAAVGHRSPPATAPVRAQPFRSVVSRSAAARSAADARADCTGGRLPDQFLRAGGQPFSGRTAGGGRL